VPQLFARLSAVDFALKARVEREVPGCAAGFMMAKRLRPWRVEDQVRSRGAIRRQGAMPPVGGRIR
jgi:hypothetical protein